MGAVWPSLNGGVVLRFFVSQSNVLQNKEVIVKFVTQITGGILLILCIALSANAQLEPLATLSLNPSTGTFMVGDIFDIEILLDTGGYEIGGVDIHFLNYDSSILEVQDAIDISPGIQILPGSLMTFTPANSVDETTGRIDFSQISFGGSTFIGSGVLATVTFKVVGTGITDLVFDFTPGQTTDTNVACCAGVDVLASATGAQFTTTAIISIAIDIKPGSDPNCFNVDGNGVIPVAVLGSSDFDVTDIDIDTLSFAGLDVRIKGNDARQCSVEDVSGDFTTTEGAPDGFDDLVCQFVDDSSAWLADDEATATLTGNLLDGTPFEGTDSICIVP
jgi:hypothetical protein